MTVGSGVCAAGRWARARALRLAVVAAGGLASLGVMAATAGADASSLSVPVENFTSQPWIGRYVATHAPEAVLALFRPPKGLALFAQSYEFAGERARWCVAVVGLTHPAPAQAHPRFPARLQWGGASGPLDEGLEGEDGCVGRALVRALGGLFGDADREDDIASTVYGGGQALKEKADASLTHAVYFGMSATGSRFVHEQLPGWFPTAFDHREVGRLTQYRLIDADQGRAICFAALGLSARAPANRMPKTPAASLARAILVEPAQRDLARRDSECFEPLFTALAQQVTPDGPLVQRLIAQWPLVAEPGRPAPSARKIADAAQAWARRPPPRPPATAVAGPVSPRPAAIPPAPVRREPRCRTEVDIERRPFNENVCDYNQYGPVNCRNVTTRYDEIRHERQVCD